ncbi:MAG: ATP-binding cassette domain-containing protein [Parachlamydia sp.]|jgi:lipopolysaccharide transport system ATP-binding protein|nr:ATP-binding cassette domain-containing protein [Parachlamydia sp.]
MNIVEIEDLSKKFHLMHEKDNPYASLKEIISDWFRQLPRRLTGRAAPKRSTEDFWALKDLNLTIEEGDRIALLGRNGAGKSTFLKLLSRITEPTTGRIKIRGRVASLLEVGTGFHPDLTGRENILLNGAIMGMSYQEMKSKFDEIVAFADIEKFLDTPIKRYSSGMFMRLGFAIAAHLDADLLIVDEVLAVGDAQFQEKCLKKMNEMGAQGSTVIFVSHNINSVLSLCNKGIFLEKGRLKAYLPIEETLSLYIQSCPTAGLSWKGQAGDEHIQIMTTHLTPPQTDAGFFYQGEIPSLQVDFDVLKPHPDLLLGFSILNSHNQPIARSRLCDHQEHYQLTSKKGAHSLAFPLDLNLFHPGEYKIKMECSLLNKKKILKDDIVLKFAVCSQNKIIKQEAGVEKEGISLGNRWTVS